MRNQSSNSSNATVLKGNQQSQINKNQGRQADITNHLLHTVIDNNVDQFKTIIETSYTTKNTITRALILSVLTGNLQIVKLLLAKFNITVQHINTAISLSITYKYTNICSQLTNHLNKLGKNNTIKQQGANQIPHNINRVKNRQESEFWNAIRTNNLNTFDQLIKHVDINKTQENQQTALICAIKHHSKDIIKRLVNHPKIDLNFIANNGWTALMNAVNYNNKYAVQVLIDNGVSPNYQTENKITPLMLASIAGYVEIILTLISKGADISMKDKNNLTALHHASINGHKEAEKVLRIKTG